MKINIPLRWSKNGQNVYLPLITHSFRPCPPDAVTLCVRDKSDLVLLQCCSENSSSEVKIMMGMNYFVCMRVTDRT